MAQLVSSSRFMQESFSPPILSCIEAKQRLHTLNPDTSEYQQLQIALT